VEKIWIDISSLSQTNLLCSLALRASKEVDVVVTSSTDPAVIRILSGRGIRFLSPSAGTGKNGIASYARRILQLTDFVRKQKPDILISDLGPAAVRTAFGVGIPVWSFYREPVSSLQHRIHQLSLPLCEKVFVSEEFPEDELYRQGLVRDQLVWFRGWNECYIIEESGRRVGTSDASGIRSYGTTVLFRPPKESNPAWVARVVKAFRKRGVRVVVRKDIDDNYAGRRNVSGVSVDPPPVLHDGYVGAGRMAAEFYLLGKPLILLPGYRYSDLRSMYESVAEADGSRLVEEALFGFEERGVLESVRRRGPRVARQMVSPATIAMRMMDLPLP